MRAKLLEWLPASVVDAPNIYPPNYDGPLDERTPGFVRLAVIYRSHIDIDRERLIDQARD
jgi:hypothetical protein